MKSVLEHRPCLGKDDNGDGHWEHLLVVLEVQLDLLLFNQRCESFNVVNAMVDNLAWQHLCLIYDQQSARVKSSQEALLHKVSIVVLLRRKNSVGQRLCR